MGVPSGRTGTPRPNGARGARARALRHAEVGEHPRVARPGARRRSPVAGSFARVDEQPPERVVVGVDAERGRADGGGFRRLLGDARAPRGRALLPRSRPAPDRAARRSSPLGRLPAAGPPCTRRSRPGTQGRRRASSRPRAARARLQRLVEREHVDAGAFRDRQPVRVAVTNQDLVAAAPGWRLQLAAKRRERDVEAPCPGLGFRVAPECLLDHLPVNRVVRRSPPAGAARRADAA